MDRSCWKRWRDGSVRASWWHKYLTNPRAMVPDTSMIYPGLKDNTKRADLVAYLATLH